MSYTFFNIFCSELQNATPDVTWGEGLDHRENLAKRSYMMVALWHRQQSWKWQKKVQQYFHCVSHYLPQRTEVAQLSRKPSASNDKDHPWWNIWSHISLRIFSWTTRYVQFFIRFRNRHRRASIKEINAIMKLINYENGQSVWISSSFNLNNRNK